jgi:sialic acid synthase SpsE
MVIGIRNLSKSLNIKKNKITISEKKNINLVNKFIVAKKQY